MTRNKRRLTNDSRSVAAPAAQGGRDARAPDVSDARAPAVSDARAPVVSDVRAPAVSLRGPFPSLERFLAGVKKPDRGVDYARADPEKHGTAAGFPVIPCLPGIIDCPTF